MLKKCLGFILVFSLIMGLTSFSFAASGAKHPNWEIIQDYEGKDAVSHLTAPAAAGGVAELSIATGAYAISGKASAKFNCTSVLRSADWEQSFFEISPKAPTISDISGYFFRMETDAPAGGYLMFMNENLWTNWATCKAPTYISDSGEVYLNQTYVPVDNFSGYVFIDISAVPGKSLKQLGWINAMWASPAAFEGWGGKKIMVDNVGYYKLSSENNKDELKAIASELNTAYKLNPPILGSISTGIYNNELPADSKTTMLKSVDHMAPGSSFAWSIDNAAVATIDANGVITPKKLGTAKVTATLTLPDKSTQIKECSIKIVRGIIYFTLEDDTQVKDAVLETGGIVGIKPKLNAGVTYNGFDNSIIWSVVSGSATIEDLDVDVENATANTLHSSYLTFKDSGKSVIRASLKDCPSVYRDITYNVKSNANFLQEKVLEAQSIGGQFTESSYAGLQKAISNSQKLLDKTYVAQAQYDKSIAAIQTAIDKLVIIDSKTLKNGTKK